MAELAMLIAQTLDPVRIALCLLAYFVILRRLSGAKFWVAVAVSCAAIVAAIEWFLSSVQAMPRQLTILPFIATAIWLLIPAGIGRMRRKPAS